MPTATQLPPHLLLELIGARRGLSFSTESAAVVTSMVVGGVTDTSARFAAKVSPGSVRIAYSVNSNMSSPSFSNSTGTDGQGVAKVTVTGLAANTRYYWQVENNSTLLTSATGQFLTDPTAGTAASFTVALAGDAGQTPVYPGSGTELAPLRISNHTIFDLIRTTALADDWRRFVHLGDLCYYDPGSGVHIPDANVSTIRTMYDDILAQSRQHQLYRTVPWVYTWDDHDYGGDNSDGTFASKANLQQVYRERNPHYDLDDAAAIYHTFAIGRVRFVVWDCRSNRSPNSDTDNASKSMLGTAQKTWFENILDTATEEALVVVSTSQWLGTQAGGDGWNSFTTERTELIGLFEDNDWLGRMCIICADAHYLAIDTGTNSGGGGIPVFQFAALDATPTETNPTRFDIGPSLGGRGQYGTLRFDDNGGDIAVTGTCWIYDQPVMWHSFSTGTPITVRTCGNPSHVLAL